ncbi:hypothetical protein [Chryseobacterium shandongense]|uniref:hypothetical protein n=1 Tax=Chryseobacterium shandongense TaxID=1493872 RepID=UPI001E56786B|nr:hypothetical protein [Chryseobacterium shandongense]
MLPFLFFFGYNFQIFLYQNAFDCQIPPLKAKDNETFSCGLNWGNFEPMAQKVITEKERKEKELSEKKKNTPFMQVDKNSDPISNFIENFKRQFKEAKSLLNWERLFGGKRTEQQKHTSKAESIIGATKTVIRSDFKNEEKNQAIQTNKKPALKMDNAIRTQQSPKSKKPKLGL